MEVRDGRRIEDVRRRGQRYDVGLRRRRLGEQRARRNRRPRRPALCDRPRRRTRSVAQDARRLVVGAVKRRFDSSYGSTSGSGSALVVRGGRCGDGRKPAGDSRPGAQCFRRSHRRRSPSLVVRRLFRHRTHARRQGDRGSRNGSFPHAAAGRCRRRSSLDGTVYCASDNGVLFALAVALEARPTACRRRAAHRLFGRCCTLPGAFGWFQNGVDAALLAQLPAPPATSSSMHG